MVEEKQHLEGRMVYVNPKEWKRWQEYCKQTPYKNVSARIRKLMAADLNGDAPVTEKFDLAAAEETEAKLASKDKSLEKDLGGETSAVYRGLVRLTRSFVLKRDFSNLNEILLSLMKYQIQDQDKFTASDVTLFRRKLQIMAEITDLRAKILAERERRLGSSQESPNASDKTSAAV